MQKDLNLREVPFPSRDTGHRPVDTAFAKTKAKTLLPLATRIARRITLISEKTLAYFTLVLFLTLKIIDTKIRNHKKAKHSQWGFVASGAASDECEWR